MTWRLAPSIGANIPAKNAEIGAIPGKLGYFRWTIFDDIGITKRGSRRCQKVWAEVLENFELEVGTVCEKLIFVPSCRPVQSNGLRRFEHVYDNAFPMKRDLNDYEGIVKNGYSLILEYV